MVKRGTVVEILRKEALTPWAWRWRKQDYVLVVEVLSDGVVVGVLCLDALLLQFVHQAAPENVDVLILLGALLDVVPGVDIYQLSVLRQVASECHLALMAGSLARTLQVVDGCRTAPIR